MLLRDHEPWTLPAGAHDFPERNVPNGASIINIRLARNTVATPTLWPRATFVIVGAAALGATSLVVDPLFANIPAGTVYTVGGNSLTLAAEGVQGATVLSVNPTPVAIPADTLVRGTEIAVQMYTSVAALPYEEGGGLGYIRLGALEEFDAMVAGGQTAGQASAALIAAGKLIFNGGGGGRRVVRGSDFVEHVVQCPLPPGTGRKVKAVVAVRGGTLDTALTIEVL